jgi:hypothetical protein
VHDAQDAGQQEDSVHQQPKLDDRPAEAAGVEPIADGLAGGIAGVQVDCPLFDPFPVEAKLLLGGVAAPNGLLGLFDALYLVVLALDPAAPIEDLDHDRDGTEGNA